MDKLIAIDGNSLMHRAYYALAGMSARDGTPTGAVFGFLNMLFGLLDYEPKYMLAAFDVKAPTFRHKEYEGYKAGRHETPDDLRTQFPIIKQMLTQMGIRVVECPGFEADDILGTFSRMASQRGMETLLVTGDKDSLQLVSDSVKVLLTKKGVSETELFDLALLKERYGLTPKGMIDLKGLMGDSSDNLPGIKGVGEKTALKLLEKYGDMEGVLTHASDEKGALRLKLEAPENIENARMSYRLGTIDVNAPIAETIEDCAFNKNTMANAIPYMQSLELRRIISRIPAQDPVPVQAPEQSIRVVPIDSLPQAELLAQRIKDAKSVAIDIALNISIAVDANEYYLIKLSETPLQTDENAISLSDALNALEPLFMGSAKKLVFDAKTLLHTLNRNGLSIKNIAFDLMIADYVLDALHPCVSLSALIKKRMCDSYEPCAANLFALASPMRAELEQKGMDVLYDEVEHPLIFVLFSMEKEGFYVDRGVLNELSARFAADKERLAGRIYELAGEEFNILSTKQLGVVLFEKLGLPTRRKTKTGFSTDSDVLESLRDMHEIVPLILEYRFITKLKSTFIDGFLTLITPDQKIHTTFHQTVTATGRISSTDPNLQNVPTRTDVGREIRGAFVAGEGRMLVDADYSQIELRVLAHISGDSNMQMAFRDGEDIHSRTASEVFNTDAPTKQQRAAAKAVNFGIVYGISDFGLATNLSISKREAGEYIERYLERFTGVRNYMSESVETARRLGYASTLLGRRRALPELKEQNYNRRAFGERVAMNMPIQGTAADIIKLAMVKVFDSLRREGLKAKLVLQVHDELIIDTPTDEVKRVEDILKECMQDAVKLSVPLIADVSSGKNWMDAK